MADDTTIHRRTFAIDPQFEEGDGLLPISQQDEKLFQPKKTSSSKSNSLPKIDRPAFAILVLLYLLQGVPVGLAFGSIPFILKTKLTYSQVGIFSLAAYPYSMKLLWSPIVDAMYFPKIGRRRSWIIPIQTISGLTLIYLGSQINQLIENPLDNLPKITSFFFILVFFCATQDIAVDGWALTCLSPEGLSFASTAQTIGINAGYFSSFTIFLALSSPDFANKYLRSEPLDEGLFTMGSYLRFWGCMYLLGTVVVCFVPEDPPHLAQQNQAKLANERIKLDGFVNKSNSKILGVLKSSSNVYDSMYQVLKLPNVQTFVVILLISKLGFQVNEAATNLKLLEKGLSKEDLSITVLVDFPFEMVFGYYSGRWSTGKKPLKPWLLGFAGRLFAAFLAQLVVYNFPSDGKVSTSYFLVIIVQHLLGSFMSTIQFVSLCAFHTKIADPAIGGTYMTTLNTLSNYGGTWPRLIIFYLIDKLTVSSCSLGYRIVSETIKQKCLGDGGEVQIIRDGYYYTNFLCISLGIVIWLWVRRKVEHLQALPNSAWRVSREK
ncbi:hypothetical protein PSN45_000143 [Yamadazyma tenuis]|uniref:MFS general substrate transporter n=1 Tax=Candida tenuis (strain ATCC 10573 / BCRC 21748 / CBS 615 / JCM 9827 / NBRC 10315 / NRRL Y-1498 / VKM Y-70) TaxID=590646 RepID=G3BAX2_CANTC|nr:MFS general substrate transporter [Yamadazyma tenuis ATCC 10573]EGV61475.1 MFS general substrate transporter [Yamadazyma tenuis ATCC 10573]WEJ92688.1 hypothetical protein PSN45_000143 [Yamadazyma tenuis]